MGEKCPATLTGLLNVTKQWSWKQDYDIQCAIVKTGKIHEQMADKK